MCASAPSGITCLRCGLLAAVDQGFIQDFCLGGGGYFAYQLSLTNSWGGGIMYWTCSLHTCTCSCTGPVLYIHVAVLDLFSTHMYMYM